jgi:hypothetical protein
MSKKIATAVTCPKCKNTFEADLYRSIWVEHAENRTLILADEINAVTCPICKFRHRSEFSFLATNVELGFAVWYEPHPDEQIDKDIKAYRTLFGEKSFYATAPRIADWQQFKQTLLDLESAQPHKMSNHMKIFARRLENKISRGEVALSFSTLKDKIGEWLRASSRRQRILLTILTLWPTYVFFRTYDDQEIAGLYLDQWDRDELVVNVLSVPIVAILGAKLWDWITSAAPPR